MLKRSTATRHIDKLRQRIDAINADDQYLCRFTFVAVFGSYVNSTKDVLGDLDVVVAYEDRPGRNIHDDAFVDAQAKYIERGWMTSFFRAWEEHLAALKHRMRLVRLHEWSSHSKMLTGTPMLVLFGKEPPGR